MEAVIRHVHIECAHCSTFIDVTVIVLKPDRETASKRPLNELLVDYGWLPTTRGYYCRQHAASVKQ